MRLGDEWHKHGLGYGRLHPAMGSGSDGKTYLNQTKPPVALDLPKMKPCIGPVSSCRQTTLGTCCGPKMALGVFTLD